MQGIEPQRYEAYFMYDECRCGDDNDADTVLLRVLTKEGNVHDKHGK